MNKFIMLSALAIIFSSAATADYKKQWCVGEDANKCPAKPVYPCPQDGGPGDKAVAKSICTINTATGEKILDHRIEVISTSGGNKCGYTVYEATCITSP
ncbi:hypothetical protein [Pseudomonas fluorescens]|uniref:hypothetical protein n=1 Tax=Pseudomonas fluorescens TaxID=294 RepID=UPI00123F15E2|nr:hypothetical protein [Pseudomonas fluorescens]